MRDSIMRQIVVWLTVTAGVTVMASPPGQAGDGDVRDPQGYVVGGVLEPVEEALPDPTYDCDENGIDDAEQVCEPHEQSCEPYLPECPEDVAAPDGGWPVPEGFMVDRRPIAFINCMNGADNPLAMHPSWFDQDCDHTAIPRDEDGNGVPDAFDWLLDQYEFLYQRGFRRIGLFLPSGNHPEVLFPSSQWYTQPPWKRDGFNTYVKAWLESKNEGRTAFDPHDADHVNLFVYAGNRPTSNICDRSLCANGARLARPSSTADMCYYYRNIQPWLDMGFSEYWLDTSVAVQELWGMESFLQLQNSPHWSVAQSGRPRIKFVGEGFPRDLSGGAPINPGAAYPLANPIDEDAITRSAWTATWRHWEIRYPDGPPVDPQTTECSVWLSSHAVVCCAPADRLDPDSPAYHIRYTLDDAWDYVSRGFVLLAGTPSRKNVEAVQRVMSMGTIDVAADFDFATQSVPALPVDDSDLTRYLQFFKQWRGVVDPRISYYHGDIDGNGVVDRCDLRHFLRIHSDGLNEAMNEDPVYESLNLEQPDLPALSGPTAYPPSLAGERGFFTNVVGATCNVNIDDLLAVVSAMGPCATTCCVEDVTDSGYVDIDDVLTVLSEWGGCE